MTNWVFNTLTIEGSPEQVNKLIEQVGKPIISTINPDGDLAFNVETVRCSNPVFSFWNIIAPTDLEAYQNQPVRSELSVNDPNWWSDHEEKSKSDNSWYNWNIRNWGTKWDVAVSDDNGYPETFKQESDNGENKVVVYQFNTAWGTPYKAMETLSSQYPTLLLTLDYEEETGWGGEAEFLRGEILSLSEYDNKCPDCDTVDIAEYCEKCGIVCNQCFYGYSEGYCSEHVRPV